MSTQKKSNDPLGYYEILGIPPGSPIKVVEKAFAKVQHLYHMNSPKRHMMRSSPEYQALSEEGKKKKEEEMDEMSKKVNKAFAVLSNPETKEQYDNGTGEYGPMGMGGGMGGMGADFPFEFFRRAAGFRGEEAAGVTLKASDIKQTVRITLAEVFSGTTKRINVNVNRLCKQCSGKRAKDSVACKTCGGKGVVQVYERSLGFISRSLAECQACEGFGYQRRGEACGGCSGAGTTLCAETKELSIRPGIKDGTQLVMKGQGNEMPGRVPGDIAFRISVTDKDKVIRVGDHLVANAEIDILTVACGGMIYYDHPSGRKLGIAVSPVEGRLCDTLVVSGEGFPTNKRGFGDLILRLNVVNNVKHNRAELSRVVRPAVSKPMGNYQNVKGRWEATTDDNFESSEESPRGGAKGGIGGFTEDILRGFGIL